MQGYLPQPQVFPPLGAAHPPQNFGPPGGGPRSPTEPPARRKSHRRLPGEPRRTYAICKCRAWRWHDLLEVKCINKECNRRWPQVEQERKRALLEARAEFEARSYSNAGRPRSRPPAGAWPPRNADAAAPPPDVLAALRIVREAAESGQLRDGEGDNVQLPADIVVDAPTPAPTPVAAPLSLKQAKHNAEQEYQKATKAQRSAYDAVRAAESLADEAEARFHQRQQALVEARTALQATSQQAEVTLQRFNDASRAYQDEVAAAGAASRDGGKSSDTGGKDSRPGSRASSRGSAQGIKRPNGPEESAAVTRAWASLQAQFKAAMASGDESALLAVSESSCKELIALQKAEKQQEADAALPKAAPMGDGPRDGIRTADGGSNVADSDSNGSGHGGLPPAKHAKAEDAATGASEGAGQGEAPPPPS